MSRGFGAALALGATCIVGGCGAGGTSPTDAGADANDAEAGATLTAIVVDLSFYGPLVPNVPLPGAIVTIDKPGGAHEETVADANGKVTFTGIDWSLGTASLTATAPGHGAYAIANFTRDQLKAMQKGPFVTQADAMLIPFPLTTALPVTATVSLTNKATATNHVNVSASNAFTAVETATDSAGLSITPSAAFSLVTYEFTVGTAPSSQETLLTPIRFAKYDEPAATPPTDHLTVDLAAAGTTLPISSIHQTVVLTGGATGPLADAHLFTTVLSLESNFGLLLGALETSTLSTDKGSFDAKIDLVSIGGQTPVTTYNQVTATNGSTITRFTAPADGDTVDGFLPPLLPAFVTHSLDDVFDASSAPPNTVTRLGVTDKSNAPVLVVDVPAGVTSFTVPKLPDATRASLKSASLHANLEDLADLDPVYLYWTRLSYSTMFAITVP